MYIKLVLRTVLYEDAIVVNASACGATLPLGRGKGQTLVDVKNDWAVCFFRF